MQFQKQQEDSKRFGARATSEDTKQKKISDMSLNLLFVAFVDPARGMVRLISDCGRAECAEDWMSRNNTNHTKKEHPHKTRKRSSNQVKQ